jgi:hypothetical protein
METLIYLTIPSTIDPSKGYDAVCHGMDPIPF